MQYFAYIHWSPDPELIDLGFFSLRWYSLCFTLGIVLAYVLVGRRFRRTQLSEQQFEQFTWYILVGIMLGMRLGHFLFYEPGALIERPWEVILPISFTPDFHFTGYQGLASHGGAIGILIGVFLFNRRFPAVSSWYLLNQLALVGPLVGVLIRTGNLMNSEIVGGPTEVAWAFIFVRVDSVPRHPAQLYEALSYFAIFLVLQYAYRKPWFQQKGRLLAISLILLFTARFVIEFFKENQVPFEQELALNMGQLLSVPFVLAGVAMLFFHRSVIRFL